MRRFRYTALLCIITAAVHLISCAEATQPFDYTQHDAMFTAVFPSLSSSGEDVVCRGEKDGDGIRLSVVSPERSSDISVIYDYRTVFLSVGDTLIPLSDTAAGEMREFFTLLYPSSEAQASDAVQMTDSGDMPMCVLLSSGRRITLADFTVQANTNNDPKERTNDET